MRRGGGGVRTERLVRCSTEGETEAIGEAVGARVRCGDLIELRGELGAGKTCWVRGLARGIGVREPVRSPTFTICHVHRGRTLLFHLDAYRLEDPAELLEQGWDEMTARGAVAVEWGERIAALLPEDRLVVEIEHGAQARKLRIRALGPRSERLLAAVPATRPNDDDADETDETDETDEADEADETEEST